MRLGKHLTHCNGIGGDGEHAPPQLEAVESLVGTIFFPLQLVRFSCFFFYLFSNCGIAAWRLSVSLLSRLLDKWTTAALPVWCKSFGGGRRPPPPKIANAEYITGMFEIRSFRRPSRALNLLWDFESKKDRGGTRERRYRIGCIFSM